MRKAATDSLIEGSQHLPVYVIQLVEIQASFSGRVLSELRHQTLILEARAEVQHERPLAGREARQQDVAFAPAFVRVVMLVEADNARSPHLRRMAGDVTHHRDELTAVVAPLLVLDLVDEGSRTDLRAHGLVRGHGPVRLSGVS